MAGESPVRRPPHELDLSGKVALVTGAGSNSGIGFAAAAHLGRLGATLAVSATSSRVQDRVVELRGMGFAVSGHVADLTQETEAQGLVDEVVAQHGRTDILVNNAGMVLGGGP